jgi:hypothetical protein
MGKPPPDELQRLRQVAQELRERAAASELPGYCEKLIKAAEQLEEHADELEALL